MVIRSSLSLNDEMVPGVAQRFARNTGGMPLLSGIVPDIPLIPAGNSAFMSPNEGLPIHKLVNVELESLGCIDICGVEVNVISKIVNIRNDRVI